MPENELLGNYKLVLGMEIHLQPKTERKMFCGCDAHIWGDSPNTHTCPTCLGLPGALPVPNFEAVKKTQLLGLALHCSLNKNSKFDRKHYFYPDLPKGYQISQYKEPLCFDGYLDLASGNRADIERVHLEEDTAKSFHEGGKTLIDFNKSGIPLIEIVSRPVFTSIADAVDYCKQIQNIAIFMGISDCDMEKGQMRLEVNISLRTAEMEKNDELADYKVEVKNINSFRFMEKAVESEIKRQRAILESGGKVAQENRGFNETRGETVAQRSKEEAKDYRYFPEPDIPPMVFDDEYLSSLSGELPRLPYDIKKEYVEKHGLTQNAANVLVDNLGLEAVKKFEDLVSTGVDPIKAANAVINKRDIGQETEKIQVPEDEIRRIVLTYPKAIEDYKKGKENSIQFLVGMVARETKGKADPKSTFDTIKKVLSEL